MSQETTPFVFPVPSEETLVVDKVLARVMADAEDPGRSYLREHADKLSSKELVDVGRAIGAASARAEVEYPALVEANTVWGFPAVEGFSDLKIPEEVRRINGRPVASYEQVARLGTLNTDPDRAQTTVLFNRLSTETGSRTNAASENFDSRQRRMRELSYVFGEPESRDAGLPFERHLDIEGLYGMAQLLIEVDDRGQTVVNRPGIPRLGPKHVEIIARFLNAHLELEQPFPIAPLAS